MNGINHDLIGLVIDDASRRPNHSSQLKSCESAPVWRKGSNPFLVDTTKAGKVNGIGGIVTEMRDSQDIADRKKHERGKRGRH